MYLQMTMISKCCRLWRRHYERSLSHLNENQLVRGGCQVIGQAAELDSEPAGTLLKALHSPIAICIIAHFTIPRRVEG